MAEKEPNYIDFFGKYDQCANCPLANRGMARTYRIVDNQRHIPHIINCSPHKTGPGGVLPARRLEYFFHRRNLSETANGKRIRTLVYKRNVFGKCPAERNKNNQLSAMLIDKESS